MSKTQTPWRWGRSQMARGIGLREPERLDVDGPILRFSPTAWAKLVFLRDLGDTEVGGFAIAAADDLLYVEDVQLVRQFCTPISVALEDEAVADFFDRQVDARRMPEQFGRIWVHTHPGNSPLPSDTDEETFARVFGRAEWAVMFILAHGGQTYARLRFNVGPGGELLLPVSVDYRRSFATSDHDAWQNEYLASVQDAIVEGPFGDLSPNWLQSDVAPWQEEWPSGRKSPSTALPEDIF